jgi:tetratricopeptide (TPR) repeat protein
MGSIEEVIPLQEQALRLGPRDPLLGGLYWRIGLVHLVKSQYRQAVASFEKTRTGYVHAYLAAAYALEGESERAAAELAEARRLSPDDRYSSIARLKAAQHVGPAIRPLLETTYYAGLRKAGMPE